MTKVDKVIPLTVQKERPKCGDCLHFKNIPKFERVCTVLGVKSFREAPTCFKANPYILNKINPDAVFQLGILLHSSTAQQKRILSNLLKEMAQVQKVYKLEFGQPVMFHIGNDYLSNYFRGYVIGGSTSGDPQIYVTSDMSGGQRSAPAMVTLMPNSVHRLSDWKKKKAQLLKEKRLKDPNPLYSSHVQKKELSIDYTPPTLENAPAEWLDKRDIKGSMKSKKHLQKSKDGTLTFRVRALDE
jgi:hypothetical protein